MGQVLRAELSPLKDLACYSPGVRSSQLHEAAGPACFTAPYLAHPSYALVFKANVCLLVLVVHDGEKTLIENLQ